MWNIILAVMGLLVGGVINVLADDLPERGRVSRPRCPHCQTPYPLTGWLALSRALFHQGKCPTCHKLVHWRGLAVELSTIILFALLPFFIPPTIVLFITAFFIAVLLLVIVIDLEHRLILHIVTFPVTGIALLITFLYGDNQLLRFALAVTGAIAGFLIFYLFYWLGLKMFGEGALGFGDVTLAMTMGAMLGLQHILFALIIGIVLGGFISALLLLTRRSSSRSYLPYGQYLAVGGIIMLIWGNQILDWYIGPAGQ